MSKYIVATDDITAEQRDAITNYVKQKFGYWHWFPDLWLLTSETIDISSSELRSQLSELAPGASILVNRMPDEWGSKWAAYAPAKSLPWLKQNW